MGLLGYLKGILACLISWSKFCPGYFLCFRSCKNQQPGYFGLVLRCQLNFVTGMLLDPIGEDLMWAGTAVLLQGSRREPGFVSREVHVVLHCL